VIVTVFKAWLDPSPNSNHLLPSNTYSLLLYKTTSPAIAVWLAPSIVTDAVVELSEIPVVVVPIKCNALSIPKSAAVTDTAELPS